MTPELQRQREAAAHAIFSTGSCRINLAEGFKIALHDALPEAPRSPFYLNLRPQGVKGGAMTPSDIEAVGRALYLLGHERDLFTHSRPICSIPAAGDPYLDVIMNETVKAQGLLLRFRLEKVEIDGKRAFRLDEHDEIAWEDTLLVDDLATSILTKQLAIKPIAANGGYVTDLLIFLNRSTDAREMLNRQGVRLHTVWEFDDLMEWALGQGYLKRREFESIVTYPSQLETYKRSVNFA